MLNFRFLFENSTKETAKRANRNIFFFLISNFEFSFKLIRNRPSVQRMCKYIKLFLLTANELQSIQMECNGLQKECSVLRSEKQDMVNNHQKEKISLQSECSSLRAEKEELLKSHQKEKANLQSECAALRAEKEEALQKQQQLQRDLVRSVQWLTLPIAQHCPPPSFCFLCPIWMTHFQCD